MELLSVHMNHDHNLCSIEGCTRVVAAKGMCRTHYMRMKRKGDTSDTRQNARKQCSESNCTRLAVGRGLCELHYRRVLRAEAGPTVHPGRTCEWCDGPIPKTRRGHATLCSAECKKNRHNALSASLGRAGNLWAKYKLIEEGFEELLAQQDYRCAICRSPTPRSHGTFHVDHDHQCCPGQISCGKCIRGLLCSPCNRGLGHFGDDPERLRAAVDYLERAEVN